MSGYNQQPQGYGHPTAGWQQNQQQYPPQQHLTQGGYCAQPTAQYGSTAPQNYGSSPAGGYQSQPSYGQSNNYNQAPPHQYNNSQPYNQYNNTQPPPAQGSGATGDRGMMGALAGGAAGGLLGKKNNHSFLGTVGGAIMGSLLEDATKKKKHGHH